MEKEVQKGGLLVNTGARTIFTCEQFSEGKSKCISPPTMSHFLFHFSKCQPSKNKHLHNQHFTFLSIPPNTWSIDNSEQHWAWLHKPVDISMPSTHHLSWARGKTRVLGELVRSLCATKARIHPGDTELAQSLTASQDRVMTR